MLPKIVAKNVFCCSVGWGLQWEELPEGLGRCRRRRGGVGEELLELRRLSRKVGTGGGVAAGGGMMPTVVWLLEEVLVGFGVQRTEI